jgi:hypothetical protein
MATTTNYGWTTPNDTDLVKDGAAAIRTLGSSVDTTTKALNPSTTLGDIEYRSATANTNTRLPIGTSGQLLSVNGSGVPAWATVSSGGMTLLSTTTLSGTSTTISSINQTYKDLLVICVGFTWNTGDHAVSVRPNGAANNVALIGATRSNATGNVTSNFSDIRPYTSNTFASNSLNSFYTLISNYTSTNCKPLEVYGYSEGNATSSNLAGGHIQTSAVTSIQFTTIAGTPTIGGTVLLYGVS